MIVGITGATGFVGKLLAEHHIKVGDEVRYLTRTNSIPIKGAMAYIGSVNSSCEILIPFLQKVDIVYHCAAELNNPEVMIETNVNGTENLVKLSVGQVKKFVLLSSTGVYGATNQKLVTEATPPKPNNPYEISKLKADIIATKIAHETGLNLVIIRPSNIYGTTMKNQSLFALINAVNKGIFFFIGKEGAVANYIHVNNVVHAMVLAANANHISNGSVYNISDCCSLEDLIAYISSTINKSPPNLRMPLWFGRLLATILGLFKKSPLTNARVNALTRKTIYSSEKIKHELGYTNQIGIEQGIKELAGYWLNAKLQTH